MIACKQKRYWKRRTGWVISCSFLLLLAGCETVPKGDVKNELSVVEPKGHAEVRYTPPGPVSVPLDGGMRIFIRDVRHRGDRLEMFVRSVNPVRQSAAAVASASHGSRGQRPALESGKRGDGMRGAVPARITPDASPVSPQPRPGIQKSNGEKTGTGSTGVSKEINPGNLSVEIPQRKQYPSHLLGIKYDLGPG